ncbi:MAG: cytochrome c biogenesis protein CcsA [Proteobacteria bacterium]|nr:cytochrome c biogenesis protein CcsA [Pseudomonadota bacterium]
MINVTIFTASALTYLVASVIYACYLLFQNKSVGRVATALATSGFVIQTLGYAMRWVETSRMGLDQTPFSFFTLYESLVFAAWIMALTYLLFEYGYKFRIMGSVIIPFIALLMLFAAFSPKVNPAIQNLPSVLQGNLFVPHAMASTAAFAAFIISVIVSGVIIIFEKNPRGGKYLKEFSERLPAAGVLDALNYKAIAIGFFLYTIGMATGAYRVNIIWGKYWNWDPAEISSVIMWFMYALILHGRYQRWCGTRSTAILSVIAFVASVLCYLINASFLLISQHYPIV